MAELTALGKDQQRRCWQDLQESKTFLLGRAPRSGLSVPWDPLISREHAELRLEGNTLTVSELATARNPILRGGRPVKQFSLASQGEFVIGDTRFRFIAHSPAEPPSDAVAEHLLHGRGAAPHFENASACLEALCQMPALIAKARSDADFAASVVELLLESLHDSLAAAVVQFDGDDALAAEPALIRWSSRGDAVQRFRPSRRLMRRAFDQQRSVVHLWAGDAAADAPQFTMSSDLDWAFCTPIPTTAHDRWCLYVSGRRQFTGLKDVESPSDLLGDLRLAELMAQFIGAVRQVRALEHVQSEMRQFFSPAVVETLVDHRAAAKLEPREGPVSVLFCDVRGFSKKVEESSDNLQAVLARVREALSVMTRAILKYEGVIADFQGDAALAFWGWPTATDDAPTLACRAALAIHQAFADAQLDPQHVLYGFRVGIGIAYGEAIAGRIGSDEQIKVGVFGPVVNVASRLQELTKAVAAPMLVDAATAAAIAAALTPQEAACRRIARVRPRGMDSPVEVFALTPGQGGQRRLSAAELRTYDEAAQALEQGLWAQAHRLLDQIPPDDGPARFLRMLLDDLGETPPADWDGALPVERRIEAAAAADG